MSETGRHTSNVLSRDALMDGRGQELTIVPGGERYVFYANEDGTCTVWRDDREGLYGGGDLFVYLTTAPTMGEAQYRMAEDMGGVK